MATIELDIIKQRSDKLTPEEKLDLIDFLNASLSTEHIRPNSNPIDKNEDDSVENAPEDLTIA